MVLIHLEDDGEVETRSLNRLEAVAGPLAAGMLG